MQTTVTDYRIWSWYLQYAVDLCHQLTQVNTGTVFNYPISFLAQPEFVIFQ